MVVIVMVRYCVCDVSDVRQTRKKVSESEVRPSTGPDHAYAFAPPRIHYVPKMSRSANVQVNKCQIKQCSPSFAFTVYNFSA